MRRTKIVATIGPATSEPDALKALLDAGVDVVRLNAAHGTPDVHAERAATARAAAASLGDTVGVLIDLPGPKLRTGAVADDEVELRTDSRFVLTADAVEGDEHRVSTTVPELARWVRVGDEVFLADGAIVLCVENIVGDDVECRVVRAGVLRSRKGMHVPRRRRSRGALHRRRRDRVGDGSSHQGRLRGPFVRAPSRGCRSGTRAPPEARSEAAPHREDRDRGRARSPRRHRRHRRRGDGRARRSRDTDSRPPGAVDPEGDHPLLQHGRQAGDHRDADARVDDALPTADPRRGERRRERGARRDRRAHALGGDRRRPLPDRHRAHDGRGRGSGRGLAQRTHRARGCARGERRRSGRVGGRARGGAGRRGSRRRRHRLPDAERHDRASRRGVPADGPDRGHLEPDPTRSAV